VEYRKLEPKETVTINGCPLHPDAAVAWAYMVTEARKDGIESPLLLPESGYRSIEKQKELYNDEVNKWLAKGLSLEEARKMARKWVATPGNSEHHTGMAVDLDMSLSSCKENAAQLKMTREYQWLRDNAKKYGFYNYEAEPWHWVYNPPSK
jgi:D-alanyl-D-alanine carboxypeptidase